MERRRFARATRRDAARCDCIHIPITARYGGCEEPRVFPLRISVAASTMPWFLARHLTVQDRPAKTDGSPTTNVTSCPTPGTPWSCFGLSVQWSRNRPWSRVNPRTPG